MIPTKNFWIITFQILINKLIKKGKKNIAMKIIKNLIIDFNKELIPWKKIIYNCIFKLKPILTVRILIKKYKKILLPNILSFEKELKIATNWLLKATKSVKKKEQFYKKLKKEILNTVSNKENLSKSLMYKKEFYDLITHHSNVQSYFKIKITKK